MCVFVCVFVCGICSAVGAAGFLLGSRRLASLGREKVTKIWVVREVNACYVESSIEGYQVPGSGALSYTPLGIDNNHHF